MSKEFWLDSWSQGYTPFHREEVHSELAKYFPTLNKDAKVLVPLCGKSLDMLWLCQQGYHVIGIELSEVAIEQFFADNQLSYVREGQAFKGEGVTLYHGDIFELDPSLLCDGVYDRAALIALPEKLRQAYVNQIKHWLKPQAKLLLKTMTYNDAFTGPPYSVSQGEIRELYCRFHSIELLEQTRSSLAMDSPLYQRGLRTTEDSLILIIH